MNVVSLKISYSTGFTLHLVMMWEDEIAMWWGHARWMMLGCGAALGCSWPSKHTPEGGSSASDHGRLKLWEEDLWVRGGCCNKNSGSHLVLLWGRCVVSLTPPSGICGLPKGLVSVRERRRQTHQCLGSGSYGDQWALLCSFQAWHSPHCLEFSLTNFYSPSKTHQALHLSRNDHVSSPAGTPLGALPFTAVHAPVQLDWGAEKATVHLSGPQPIFLPCM